uniref:Uncharacterized protein n=1 Tax=viral metagenome TaxID=1070528 RepID=A0A6C0J3S3_9ZZZZ
MCSIMKQRNNFTFHSKDMENDNTFIYAMKNTEKIFLTEYIKKVIQENNYKGVILDNFYYDISNYISKSNVSTELRFQITEILIRKSDNMISIGVNRIVNEKDGNFIFENSENLIYIPVFIPINKIHNYTIIKSINDSDFESVNLGTYFKGKNPFGPFGFWSTFSLI